MIFKSFTVYSIMIILFMMTGGMGKKMASVHQDVMNSPFVSSKMDSVDGATEEVKIGLLLPVAPDKELLALAAKEGAELAVMLANLSGRYKDKTFKLIVRTTDGLWGAGSKESVKFVYEDEAVAIITALDGRNAHLAEQVAAKSQVVQLATRATDETLSQAFVPWFFRVVPNDNQQAGALIDEILLQHETGKVSIIYEDVYDYRSAAETFEKLAVKKGLKVDRMISFDTPRTESVLPEIKGDTEFLVISGSFSTVKPVLDKIKETRPELQVYGMLSMTADGQIGAGFSTGSEGGIFVGSRFCYTTRGQEFKKAYIEEYGHMPNPAASYAFDGTSLILEAIRTASTDRKKIRDVLSGMRFTEGATGPIEFDQYGNRISPVFLVKMIKGHPVILHP